MKLEMYLGTFNAPSIKTPCIANGKLSYNYQKQQEASMQIFYEIIQNSIDNYEKTKDKANYYIKVDVSPRSFTITNNGRVFDN